MRLYHLPRAHVEREGRRKVIKENVMANWQRRLDVKDVWKQAKANLITPAKLAAVIADRLEALKPFGEGYFNQYGHDLDEDKEQIVTDFRGIAEDEDATFDGFDVVWNELYNWGDIELDKNWPRAKVCWIGTF